MPRKPKNLSLDESAIRRAERYSEIHSTNVSQLVNDFLSRLPVGEADWRERLSPGVRRLVGSAKGSSVEDYREFLSRKYDP